MKTLSKIGLVFATFGVMTLINELHAQSATTVTSTTVQTSTGSLTEFVPGSNVVVLGDGSSAAPMRYSITETTTIVDPSGNPIAVENIPVGSPLSVEYEAAGGQMVAERIVVRQALGAPASVVEKQQTTVTTSTRPMTEEEVEAREEAAEAREEMREEMEDARD